AYENYPVDKSIGEGIKNVRLSVRELQVEERANYRVTIQISPGDRIGMKTSYDRGRYTDDEIRRMMGHFGMVLEGVSGNCGGRLCQLPLLTEAERYQLVMGWNETEKEYPGQQCIHRLFEEQVERSPDAVAVIHEDEQLCFRKLNQRANQLARYLQRFGV